MDNDTISEEHRKELARLLPEVLCKAVESYDDFISQSPSEDNIKTFNAQAAASKTALANINELVKLIEKANEKLDTGAQKAFLHELMQNAVSEVDDFKNKTEIKTFDNDDTAH